MSNGIPIFVTEYGLASVWPNVTLELDLMPAWYKYFNQYFLSHATWSMSNVPELFSAIQGGITTDSTPAAQVGAIVANSAYFTENGIFVNQRHQNQGILFKILTKPH
jgi:hypothetical protein